MAEDRPKILVVDDEAELKNALVEALSAHSFEVRGFCDPNEALTALAQESFDILLSDLMMPQMDGISLVEKALEIDPHLIAIIMTGQGAIQTAVDAMKIGAFDYVLKPFRFATLLPTLTRAINARRLRLENMQLRETVAIYELCQTIAFTLDQQTVISKLADAALQQTEADEVSVLLPTTDGNELYVAAVRGANRQRLLGERVPLEESISGWVASAREPLLLNGEVDDSRFHPLWPHPEIQSAISVPMQVAGKLVGTININAIDRARPFTLGQMKALTILASTAAAALQTASLYEQVQDQRERLDQVVATVPGVVWEGWGEPDAATQRINFVSDYVETMLGYSVEEWLSTPNFWLQIVHPDDKAHAAEVTAASFASGEPNGIVEFRWIKKDGSTIWVESNWTVIKDESSKPVGMRGVTTDITERKRAEEALRESEERYKNLSDTAFDGIVIHAGGKIVSLNRAYAEMFGYSVEELIGEDILKLTPADEKQFVSLQIDGDGARYEAVGLRKDGAVITIEVAGQACNYEGKQARLAAVRD
ncbi:MAG TPA: PAS domain S-box protein, partial [Pyrinomonadaceae bacterium]|nr:PAS domain S-box protein [Pyrinomonadaceae bacterium]